MNKVHPDLGRKRVRIILTRFRFNLPLTTKLVLRLRDVE